MNYHEKILKLRKACEVSTQNIEKMVESFLPLENYFLNDEEKLKTYCYVPTEPNFQLPNVFLKTATNSACKKYIQSNKEQNNYSDVIDEVIEELETLFCDEEYLEENKVEQISEETLNELYKKRYGM